jgi:26S proteasome regulatory subunit RPN6 N-terminal domain
LTLLKTSGNDLFTVIPKAKTAKIVRNILELVAAQKVPDSLEIQVRLCRDVVEWCKAEKRTFLKQRIEAKVNRTCGVFCDVTSDFFERPSEPIQYSSHAILPPDMHLYP